MRIEQRHKSDFQEEYIGAYQCWLLLVLILTWFQPLCTNIYTPKAVVIDSYLPRQPLMFILCSRLTTAASCLYSVGKWDGAPSTLLYAYNRHLSFDVAFICSTLTHCGVCHLSVVTSKMGSELRASECLTLEIIFCQSSIVLHRLRLCRTSDTVFRREIDSRRQWGYGTCYGGSFPACELSVTNI